MKLLRKKIPIERISSFDFQIKLKIKREISEILHPEKILSDKLMTPFTLNSSSNFPILNEKFSDEICCIQKLLKSLENVLIISKSSSIDETILILSNRRRHILCQIMTVYIKIMCEIVPLSYPLQYPSSTFLNSTSINKSIPLEVSSFAAQIIKYLQMNFSSNCEEYPRADLDQQIVIKLFLDSAYSIVPQLQNLI